MRSLRRVDFMFSHNRVVFTISTHYAVYKTESKRKIHKSGPI